MAVLFAASVLGNAEQLVPDWWVERVPRLFSLMEAALDLVGRSGGWIALIALILFASVFEYLFRHEREVADRFAPKADTENTSRELRAAIEELRADRLLIVRRGALQRRLRSAQHAQTRIPQLAEEAKARSLRSRLGDMDAEYFSALRGERMAAMRAVFEGLADDLPRGLPPHDEIPRDDPVLQRALPDEPAMEARQGEYRWWTLQPPNDTPALRFIISELERELANVQVQLEDVAA